MITLYKPKLEELTFKQELLRDPKTMDFNMEYGGTIDFNQESWASWYNYWLINHDNKRFYRYIKQDNLFIGEVAYHYEDEKFLIDVIIMAKYRGLGYGAIALKLLEEEALKNGINELYDTVGINNPGINLFLKNGYQVLYKTSTYIMVYKKLKKLIILLNQS